MQADQIRFSARQIPDLQLSCSQGVTRIPDCDAIVIPAATVGSLRDGTRWSAAVVVAFGPIEALPLALAMGADDFLREPWSTDELFARVRARRGHATLLEVENGALSPVRRRLLGALLHHRGRVVPRKALEALLPRRGGRGSRAVDVHVSAIRKEISQTHSALAKCVIESVQGEGYVLRERGQGCG